MNFGSILLLVMSFYVVHNIYFNYDIYHLKKREIYNIRDGIKEPLIQKGKIIYKESQERLNSSCTRSLDEFMEYTVSEINNESIVGILISDITNSIYFMDYGKLGCYDYDKVRFAEEKFEERIRTEVKNRTIIYQIIHYSFKFINVIIYFPAIITSLISIIFVDLFHNFL